ncbi:MAG: hypothetical protein ISR59_00050 [Anaerolineales bacterium]|uniref:Nucleotidyltransferase family protein n=1 Tax=Candidatus Desulfolinea nitratireducens TaxID=2841698 RepID=A0A8J6TIN5_9CHLR|nr:hypothetical protein [Candidatus Desulfolinea nitratireducens]MBL6959471.1 hypothetical protein [Anaerolineales bacterium]
MKKINKMNEAELSAFVQAHLEKEGIDVVLSGGSVVTIYSNNKYVSKDLDLVNRYAINHKKIRSVMIKLGFQEQGRYFTHLDTELFIEFPAGPLAIGEEVISDIVEREVETGTLRIISPTDCVKDRLAAYYHWNDHQCLVQAEYVAQSQNVDLEEVEKWSEREGMLAKFEEIRSRLK